MKHPDAHIRAADLDASGILPLAIAVPLLGVLAIVMRACRRA
jgi:hypothetical protein